MTLFDDNIPHNPESSTSTMTEPVTTSADDSTAEVALDATTQRSDDKPPASGSDDFASALESFTTETEEAKGEDKVLKGTVLKLTPTHVVVDIGAKSEGMLPLSEVLDHEGKPRFQPGDEIAVMRDKGEAEEGYINLSHQKAQKDSLLG